jgi:outer membrane protein
LHEQSNAKLTAGRVSQLDVLRAQQLVAQAEAERIDSVAALDSAKDELRLLMNEGPDFEFAIDPALPSVPAPPSADDAVTVALARRPELHVAADRVDDAERAVSAARTHLRPQLDFQVGVTRQSTGTDLWSSLGSEGFQLTSGIAASVPFNRTQQTASYEIAVLDRAQRARELEARRAAVVFETRRALREQQRAQLSVDLAANAAALAEKEVDVARLRFDRGLASSLDVVAAESGLLAAESRRIETKAALVVARLSLLAVMGTFDPSTDLK